VIIRKYPFVHGTGHWRLPYLMVLTGATGSGFLILSLNFAKIGLK
jgi:hypothetical protein